MSIPATVLEQSIQDAIAPGFRSRLQERGLARGLIWSDGVLPEGSPHFSSNLTSDLLDYAYSLISLSLQLREQQPQAQSVKQGLNAAAEAIEAAIVRGAQDIERGSHLVVAASAFHMAGYSARAYSVLSDGVAESNLAPTEHALLLLIRRSLDELTRVTSDWLRSSAHSVEVLSGALRTNDLDGTDIIHVLITNAFMASLAIFERALLTGSEVFAEAARARLRETAQVAQETGHVRHWWTCWITSHLIDDLWSFSLHRLVPLLPPENPDHQLWAQLRHDYIQRLRQGNRAAIELWPSQVDAARRSIDTGDNLVVSIPTGGGKTRIAEICILRALSSRRRVIYVTPLRSLSAQVERDLTETFLPLGYAVSTLYGSAAIREVDSEILKTSQIVVATPEKLDFALRSDPHVIDDVGLIILDEGHMLGAGAREVRYEVLVQRLLLRADSSSRRIVCLSAMFPSGNELTDLVGWIRSDSIGSAVQSDWRPTRQRFGYTKHTPSGEWLEIQIGNSRSFVPRYVQPEKPPAFSRRRNPFPHDKQEAVLAVAWRFAKQGKNVLVFCTEKRSVEPLGLRALDCIRRQIVPPLVEDTRIAQEAIAVGSEWLGENHVAILCLRLGVVLHHGGFPRPFLAEIEKLLKSSHCPLAISSPTLAQGLNLSASVVIIPTLWREGAMISASELANVAGRAGRPYVDNDGLTIHTVWEGSATGEVRALNRWKALIKKTRELSLASGLFQLVLKLCGQISESLDVPFGEVLEHVMETPSIWNMDPAVGIGSIEDPNVLDQWELDIASLDAALLSLVDPATEVEQLENELNRGLAGSLFSRHLARKEPQLQQLIRGVMLARAQQIWKNTDPVMRRSWFGAGLSPSAGQHINAHQDILLRLIIGAETAISNADSHAAAQLILEFAEIVFQARTFRAKRVLPSGWQHALVAWLNGEGAPQVDARVATPDVFHDIVSYHLPWAIEAVRACLVAKHAEYADRLGPWVSLAVSTGSTNPATILLIRRGLSSREVAKAVVETTHADFQDHSGLIAWLKSDKIRYLSQQSGWPMPGMNELWQRFFETELADQKERWIKVHQLIDAKWRDIDPAPNEPVIVEPYSDGAGGDILSLDWQVIGHYRSRLAGPSQRIMSAFVSDTRNEVSVSFFGPKHVFDQH